SFQCFLDCTTCQDVPICTVCYLSGLKFTKNPANLTVTQGNMARLGCAIEGLSEPEIVWMKDGEKLYSTDQMYITLEAHHWETFHSVKSVQQQDAGKYWCEVEYYGTVISSEPAWITVEGVPHFTKEPEDVATFPGAPFNLTCAAVGPPEPVEVLWWLGGVQEGDFRPSPSVLFVRGVNDSVKFYCEAKNARGISISRTGTVHIKGRLCSFVILHQELCLYCVCFSPSCSQSLLQMSKSPGRKVKLPELQVTVPPFQHTIDGLNSHTNYSVRIRCDNEVGSSPFSPWIEFETPEAGTLKTVFKPPGGETVVSFTAARSFNRQCPELPESTLDSLGINDELKAKLRDVLIPERLLTLGHMLGKGEFGSVREAFLKTEDGSVQKVAVKVLKTDINSSSDIEQCLKEAAYMKDFHHPNVIQLIGVSLHRRPQQRLPIPMVILPFMKHGDLHTFLLMSRLGDDPFTLSLQMLVQFMLDVARGMEYLSSKNIIHRDLAARNCMLNESMTVCVADFGLSKKIYSGDYYRQGSVSKLPVKWIALESLADNVYTTQSDVWAFGVTMWEIMARGQTPYPGVENSEIYEYLIKGERLKQPPDCPDDIYEIMHSCWSPVPKCRPSFQHLIAQLESLWAGLSPAPAKEPLLYVNLEGEEGEPDSGLGAGDEKDWLMVSSGAALAIGGDYRYIIGPCGAIDGESRRSEDGLSEDAKDEEEDIINV
uniref:Tyrosine-protein kinase receptor TYRO3 n=1 Tax=Astyanax mexicanus TaxID=7994 RepID=A0A8B9KQ59_ASTMX